MGASGATDVGLSDEARLRIWQNMLRIRRFEEELLLLAAQGHTFGNYHLYIGQEATGCAVLEAASDQDLVLSNHRNHGHVIGRGVDAGRAFAEMLGRKTGLLGGRGGGLHLCDPTKGFLQTSAIVGGSISLAAGAAFGITQTGGGRVAIGFFGDGSLEEGIAYEALNMAALGKLPVIFICENNTPGALGTSNAGYPVLVHASQKLTAITEALGISSHQVNGEDAGAVYQHVARARKACLEGGGPFFFEMFTTRWPGSQSIVPKGFEPTSIRILLNEVQPTGKDAEWIVAHDPIRAWTRALVADGIVGRDRLIEMDAGISEQIGRAARFALDSEPADPATALTGVFAS
jgi:TPP-dependent pyruvate/acetoin dehydrogenase alpha subunit